MVRQVSKRHDVKPAALSYAADYFKRYKWRLEVDASAHRALREGVTAGVAPRYSKVSAGSRFIDKGEIVTQRHLLMLKAMKEALNNQRHLFEKLPCLGTALLSLLIILLAGLYFSHFHKEIFSSNRQLFLLFIIVLLSIALAKSVEKVLLDRVVNGIDLVDFQLVIPLPAILLASLFPLEVASFICAALAVVLAIALPVESVEFITVNFVCALVAFLNARQLFRRRKVISICAQIWTVASLVVIAQRLYETPSFDWPAAVEDVATLFAFMAVTAILVIGLLPILEAAFRIMTDMTLMEYVDPNRELLRRLAVEAPGTYQHSLLVAHLAECGASAIGAKALFCRVSSLYHDIGKLAFPHYFAENQQGLNVHQLLTPAESAQVIISHVSEGVALARRHALPEPFIDIIKEHHGTALVYYFYRKECELRGGAGTVDERHFRYCGPRPRTRESAIIMMCDCLEAASRSLEQVNEESAAALLDSIVRDLIADNQFDITCLTFQELSLVKKSLVKTLVAASHTRIKYPKRLSDDS
jgi:hypothetical protein